jgi:chorismate synthase
VTANQWGQIFRIQTFGESHGPALGVVIEGCPAGLKFDPERLKVWMDRRRPGQNQFVSGRGETDQVEILSGFYENVSLGTPISMIVRNQDAKSSDYDGIKTQARAGHADDVWKQKFGVSDHRGGGRSSGRETVSRVMAGAVAEVLVNKLAPELKVIGFCKQIGPFEISKEESKEFLDHSNSDFPADNYSLRFPSKKKSAEVETLLAAAKQEGKSYGGQVEIVIQGVPMGLGQPVLRKLKSDLAQVALSVGATMAFEFGDGWSVSDQEGSQFHSKSDSESYGGIRGGISTGEPIQFRVAFKPTSSVLDVAKKGRHDPCIVPRALPVMEAMTWIVLADHLLWRRLDQI